MSVFLWLVFFINGGTTHQYSSTEPQGDNIASSCLDNDGDGSCDPTDGASGVGYGGRTAD